MNIRRVSQCFFQAICIGTLSGALLTAPMYGQSQPTTNLSHAVVSTTSQAAAALYAQVKSGTLKPGDFQSTATALKILFAYLQEQGVNATLDAAIRRNPSLSNAPGAGALAQEVYAQLRGIGVSGITVDQIQTPLDSVPDDTKTTLSQQGAQHAEVQLIAGLVALASESAATNTKFINHRHARLQLTGSVDCQAIENDIEVAGGLGLEALIAGQPEIAAVFLLVAATYQAEYNSDCG